MLSGRGLDNCSSQTVMLQNVGKEVSRLAAHLESGRPIDLWYICEANGDLTWSETATHAPGSQSR